MGQEVIVCGLELDTEEQRWRPLHPGEAQALGNASPRRLRQFTAGRHCAAEALHRLGLPSQPLLRGQRGEPRWPEGVAGSITHNDDQAAAAVCSMAAVRSVGIDVEGARPLNDGVARRVCSEHELCQVAGQGGEPFFATVIFSAKESVYKAWYPRTRRPLGFHDVEIHLDPGSGTFAVRFCGPQLQEMACAVGSWHGSYALGSQQVYTAVTVAPPMASLRSGRSGGSGR